VGQDLVDLASRGKVISAQTDSGASSSSAPPVWDGQTPRLAAAGAPLDAGSHRMVPRTRIGRSALRDRLMQLDCSQAMQIMIPKVTVRRRQQTSSNRPP